ncbi:MAG TPA: OmpA family protein [Bacteroidia bacterium]|nr:OmpA family protein [Bacteroidia bacterium]HNT80539.1 OmpA family protein [Bacteroidia bacterium]
MKKVLLLLFIGLFCTVWSVEAKRSKTAKADKAYDQAYYSKAAELYKKAYAKFSKKEIKQSAAYKAGESYRMMANYKEAMGWYEKSIKAGNKESDANWHFAEALRANGLYAEAIAQYNKYKELFPENAAKADAGIAVAEQAQKWKDKPTKHTVTNLSALNTRYHDFAPSYSNTDKNTVFFTSSREESEGNTNDYWIGQKPFDIFKSIKDNNGKWSIPVSVGSPVNSDMSEGSVTIVSQGNVMYITRCVRDKSKAEMCKIYKTTFDGNAWSEPEGLPFNSDSYTVGQPTLTGDGSTMYFSSDMPGGMGGKDIWRSTYNKDAGIWEAPVNLGSMVNSDKDEYFPYAHENGRLYYASNGKPGMGGLDLFWTSSEGADWSEPTNLMSPMNSPADDFGISFFEENKGYISSNREGGLGGDDVYEFYKEPPVFWIRGRVYDTDTKESIAGAKVELFGSDGTTLSYTTLEDGTYRYDMKGETKYKVSASYTGYLTKFLEVSTIGLDETQEFIGDFDFPLKSTAKPIELPEIYYDFDKASLRPESKKELDGLIKVLDENPTIRIKLVAHCDFRGTDAYNDNLSNRRAKSVMDYLIQNGVAAARLASEGKGKREPIVAADDILKMTSIEEKERAHQRNRRTEFEVVGTDYVPN